jgi:hypothetical protein
MVRIEELEGMLIIEDRACLLEGNAMFPYVGFLRSSFPLEPQVIHKYVVRIGLHRSRQFQNAMEHLRRKFASRKGFGKN